MPHSRPSANMSAQMIKVEETIRMPAWRKDSPKKRKTRRPQTSRIMLPAKRPNSPVEARSSRGVTSSSFTTWPPVRWPRSARVGSLDHQDVRVRRQEQLRVGVVEREDREEGDDNGLVDGASDALGAAGGGHALVAADDRDDGTEDGGLQGRAPQVGGGGVGKQGVPEGTERLAV